MNFWFICRVGRINYSYQIKMAAYPVTVFRERPSALCAYRMLWDNAVVATDSVGGHVTDQRMAFLLQKWIT